MKRRFNSLGNLLIIALPETFIDRSCYCNCLVLTNTVWYNRYPSKHFLLRLVRGPQSQWETWFVRRRQGFIFWGRKRLQTRILLLENVSVVLLSSFSYFFFLQLYCIVLYKWYLINIEMLKDFSCFKQTYWLWYLFNLFFNSFKS